jgi:hypothetical protein
VPQAETAAVTIWESEALCAMASEKHRFTFHVK